MKRRKNQSINQYKQDVLNRIINEQVRQMAIEIDKEVLKRIFDSSQDRSLDNE